MSGENERHRVTNCVRTRLVITDPDSILRMVPEAVRIDDFLLMLTGFHTPYGSRGCAG